MGQRQEEEEGEVEGEGKGKEGGGEGEEERERERIIEWNTLVILFQTPFCLNGSFKTMTCVRKL